MSDIPTHVYQHECHHKYFSTKDLAELRLKPQPFMSYVQMQQEGEEEGWGFKTSFVDQLHYQSYENLMNRTVWVDDVDVAQYYDAHLPTVPLATRDFTFKYSDSFKTNVLNNKKLGAEIKAKIEVNETAGKWWIIDKLLKYKDPKNKSHQSKIPLAIDLTVKNIKSLNDILISKIKFTKEINKFSSHEDIDEMINEIRKNTTLNVVNVPVNIDLVNNIDHPFYPPSLNTPFRTLKKKDFKISGIVTPYMYYSYKYSHSVMHLEDRSYGSINVNLGPGNNLWFFINEADLPKYIKALKNSTTDASDCPGFIRTKGYLVTCKWLKENKIGFKLTIQEPGDIIITPANALHQVICLGECFKHSVNFPDSKWFSLTEEEFYICKDKNDPHGTIYPTECEEDQDTMRLDWEELIRNEKPNVSSTQLNAQSSATSAVIDSLPTSKNKDKISNENSNKTITYKRPRKSCHVCSRSFSANRALKDHLSSAHKELSESEKIIPRKVKDVKCPGCTMSFDTTQSVNRHIKSFHKQSGPIYKRKRPDQSCLQCIHCSKFYFELKNLKRHVKSCVYRVKPNHEKETPECIDGE